jgi:hypothetical protein
MEHPSLPRKPDGLQNRRRLRQEALHRLAAEETSFAATPPDPAPRRRALRIIARSLFAIFVATLARNRLIPAAAAQSNSNSNSTLNTDPDNTPGDVYGGPPPDDDTTDTPPANSDTDPKNTPGDVYGGPPPEDDETPPPPPAQNKPPAPVYGGAPPASSN